MEAYSNKRGKPEGWLCKSLFTQRSRRHRSAFLTAGEQFAGTPTKP